MPRKIVSILTTSGDASPSPLRNDTQKRPMITSPSQKALQGTPISNSIHDDHVEPALIALSATVQSRLVEVFHRCHHQLNSFWGILEVIQNECNVSISPQQLERMLSQLGFANIEDAGSSDSSRQRHLTETTFLMLLEMLAADATLSEQYLENDHDLVCAALVGDAAACTDGDVASTDHHDGCRSSKSEGSLTQWEGIATYLKQFRAAATTKPPPTVVASATTSAAAKAPPGVPQSIDTTSTSKASFTQEEAERVWQQLFVTQKRSAVSQHNETSALDAFSGLSKELQELLAARAISDNHSDGSSHDVQRLLYLESKRTLTRITSQASVRKQFMHRIDFSKGIEDTLSDTDDGLSPTTHTVMTFPDGANSNGRSPETASVVSDDNVKQSRILSTLVLREEACKATLQHNLLSEEEEMFMERKQREADEQRLKLLARFQSSESRFANRKKTTRLKDLKEMIQSSAASATDDSIPRTPQHAPIGLHPLHTSAEEQEDTTSSDAESSAVSSHPDEFELQRRALLLELAAPFNATVGEGDDSCHAANEEVYDTLAEQKRPSTTPAPGMKSRIVIRRRETAFEKGRGIPLPRRRSPTKSASSMQRESRTELKQCVLTKEERRLLKCRRLSSAALERVVEALPESAVPFLTAEAKQELVSVKKLFSHRRIEGETTNFQRPYSALPLPIRPSSSCSVFTIPTIVVERDEANGDNSGRCSEGIPTRSRGMLSGSRCGSASLSRPVTRPSSSSSAFSRGGESVSWTFDGPSTNRGGRVLPPPSLISLCAMDNNSNFKRWMTQGNAL